MKSREELFVRVLKLLESEGVLSEIILVGSWCQLFYKEYFDNAPQIPSVRTMDADFLVPNPTSSIKKEVDVPKILEQEDFSPKISFPDGLVKYVHPELEIEFLIPQKGTGDKPIFDVPALKVNAQPLRFFDHITGHILELEYQGIKARVPEAAYYVVHKLVINERRQNEMKKEKDLQTAKAIGEFLLEDQKERENLKIIFEKLPKKWKKMVLRTIESSSEELYQLFTEIK